MIEIGTWICVGGLGKSATRELKVWGMGFIEMGKLLDGIKGMPASGFGLRNLPFRF